MTRTRTAIHADLYTVDERATLTAEVAENRSVHSGTPFVAVTLTIGTVEMCIYLRHPETITALRGALRQIDEQLGQTVIAQTAEAKAVA